MRSLNYPLLSLVLVTGLATSAAGAELHRPLPASSTQRNGEPEPLRQTFVPVVGAPGPPVPARLARGVPATYSGAPIDVKTYHYDGGRTGWNARETDLTPATVASARFGQIANIPVSGLVLAQPLLVSNFPMPDGKTHDVLIVATTSNWVYAFDAATYALLWQVSLGTPQSEKDVACNVLPDYGITSTPTIARPSSGAATLYVVAATEPAPFSFHHQLHALDLRTGADVAPPVEIAPSAPLAGGGRVSFDPQNEYNRTALAHRHGSIYVGLGAHCDHDAAGVSGWVVRYDSQLRLVDAFNTVQSKAAYELSSVWMSGSAPAVDAQGNVYFVVGNGYFSQTPGALGFGESVVSLTPDLKVRSTFTPADWTYLNGRDLDFGSGGIMLLPTVPGQTAPPLAVTIGKRRKLFLLNQNRLGGLQANNAGALWHGALGAGYGLWGAPAYYADAAGGLVFLQVNKDVLRSYRVNAGASPGMTPVATGTVAAGFGGSMPIVSSNGSRAGTAVVWLVHRGLNLSLEAYDAEKLGPPIFQAAAGVWFTDRGNALLTPMEANGRVYVGGYKTVNVFGLTQ
ncbi:MAG TPA: hypothetical protein VGS12_04260 [Caulobacteraceae bacterium]|nr:hypothetical protein [Caulobacteraceae bacterium]